MNRFARWTVSGAAVLGVTAAFILPTSVAGASAAPGSTLTIATTAAVTTFDPILSASTEVGYMANAYQGLTYAQSQNGTVVIKPELAVQWTHSNGGKTWTFLLRKGVYFHDGTLMTAQAVVNSFNTLFKSGDAYLWGAVQSVSVAGPYEIRFQLKYAAPLDRIASSEYDSWVVGPKGLKETQAWFNKGNDDGTGPYYISKYLSDREVDMTAFQKYWGGWKGPHYTKIVNMIIPQSAVQQEMVQAGTAQIAGAIPVQSLASIKANPNLSVSVAPSFYWYQAFFNTKKAPLNNRLVREALSYAIPYNEIVKVATGGYGRQMQGPLPFGQFPHVGTEPQYHYDLQKARQLLAEAGHKGGGFTLTLTYAAENPEEAEFAPLIKESFAQIGVGVTLKSILFNEQWSLAKGNPLQAQDMFLLLDWPGYSDSTPDLQAIYECSTTTVWNLAYYCNQKLDTQLNTAAVQEVTNLTAARQLYQQVELTLYNDAPAAWLYQDAGIIVLNKSVGHFIQNPAYPFVIFCYPLQPKG